MNDKDSVEKIIAEMKEAGDRCRASDTPEYVATGNVLLAFSSRLAALSQPGEVTGEMFDAAYAAYDSTSPHSASLRAAITAALGAQTRGEGELLGYLYADDQRNLRQSGMAVIYKKKQIFHLTPKQSCIPVFAASPDQQKVDA